jgi:hypothetical protein
MPRDFFDPPPEQQKVTLIDAVTLRDNELSFADFVRESGLGAWDSGSFAPIDPFEARLRAARYNVRRCTSFQIETSKAAPNIRPGWFSVKSSRSSRGAHQNASLFQI